MLNIRHPLSLAAALAFAVGTAHAQQAGSYVGTTSEGYATTITVVDDGSGGLNYAGVNVGWNMNCKTGDTKTTWWGVGASTPLTSNKLTVTNAFNFLYEKLTLKWSADGQTVTGTFIGDEPMYVDISTSKKVEACTGSKLTYTATLGAVAAVARPLPEGVRVKHVD